MRYCLRRCRTCWHWRRVGVARAMVLPFCCQIPRGPRRDSAGRAATLRIDTAPPPKELAQPAAPRIEDVKVKKTPGSRQSLQVIQTCIPLSSILPRCKTPVGCRGGAFSWGSSLKVCHVRLVMMLVILVESVRQLERLDPHYVPSVPPPSVIRLRAVPAARREFLPIGYVRK